jgi:hypothetical protein
MKLNLVWLLVLLPPATALYQHRVDLEPMLQDAEALRKLTIMYAPPSHQGFQLFFVRGDGSLILQIHPQRPTARTDIPTCLNKVSQGKVKDLVSLIIHRQFWDLPEKNFIFIDTSQGKEQFELHQIAVDSGVGTKAFRTFGVGTYAGKQETIPSDFAAVEQQIIQLKDFTLSNKPCHFAPAVEFGGSANN